MLLLYQILHSETLLSRVVKSAAVKTVALCVLSERKRRSDAALRLEEVEGRDDGALRIVEVAFALDDVPLDVVRVGDREERIPGDGGRAALAVLVAAGLAEDRVELDNALNA